MLIRNAILPQGGCFTPGLCVRLREGAVSAVGPDLAPQAGEEALDLGGDFLLPGFVDVHIHGFGGHDAMRGEVNVRAMSRDLFALGVAAFCPTTMSASVADTNAALAGIRAVMERPEPRGARVLGAHMEAPFLNPEKAGAQQARFFADPDWDVFLRLTGGHPEAVRCITVAPERPGSEAFIRAAAAAGIRVSLGHSGADAECAHRAADAGADRATHLFNASSPFTHRAPGLPGAALADDRFYCEMICDGVHLHRDTVRLIARCKGPEKAVAVTDAMEAAGLPDGLYALGGQQVTVRRGEARLTSGTLAGSVLTMPLALENLIHRFGLDPAAACAMVTAAPAASVGAAPCGSFAPGSPAPLTRWTPDWHFAGIVTEETLDHAER